MKNPFRYFKTSLEVIRLAVMMYVRYSLSLRLVEDLLLCNRQDFEIRRAASLAEWRNLVA